MDLILKAAEKSLKLVGFKGLGNLVEILRWNGGLKASFWKLYRNDDLKKGEYVGDDEFGNRYFQNDYYFFGRNRWVEYADHVGLNYDGSQISPQWYGWLHYKTDLLPSEDPNRPDYPWMLKHVENRTGTNEAYMAYSTTKPKISLWAPKSKLRA